MRIFEGAVLTVFFFSGQLACRSTVIAAQDYDQTCRRHSDCAIASFGDACDACLAELGVVNVDEVATVVADASEAEAACPPWSERFLAECVLPLPQVAPVCVEGRCAIPQDGTPCTFDATGCRGVDDP